MLKLIKEKIQGNIGYFAMEIENQNDKLYHIVFDVSKKYEKCISSDVPDDLKMYRSQARIALDRYYGKEIPDKIIRAWY